MSRQISTDSSFYIMKLISLLVAETVNKSRLFRLLYYLINCKVLGFSRRPLETLESDAHPKPNLWWTHSIRGTEIRKWLRTNLWPWHTAPQGGGTRRTDGGIAATQGRLQSFTTLRIQLDIILKCRTPHHDEIFIFKKQYSEESTYKADNLSYQRK